MEQPSIKTKNKNTKAINEHLASEEMKHLNTFQSMLNTIGQYQPPEAYAEEYMLCLKSLVDSSVFSNVTEAQQKAEKISGEIEVLDTEIQAEKDGILFYTEMQNFVMQPDHQVVLNIIDEEKANLRQLSQLKKHCRKLYNRLTNLQEVET